MKSSKTQKATDRHIPRLLWLIPIIFIVGAGALVLHVISSQSKSFQAKTVGSIISAEGTVLVKVNKDWEVVDDGTAIAEAPTVKTEDGKASIRVNNIGTIRVYEDTEIDIDVINDTTANINVKEGQVYFAVDKGTNFNVTYGKATVQTVGTIFYVGDDTIKVLEGKVKVMLQEEEYEVEAMQEMHTEQAQVQNVNREELKNSEVFKWCFEADKKEGKMTYEENKPSITIEQPKDYEQEVKVDGDKLEVKGKVGDDTGILKIVVNDVAYKVEDVSEDGQGLKEDGTFTIVASVANTKKIKIIAYDVFKNKSEITIKVSREESSDKDDDESKESNNTQEEKHFYVAQASGGENKFYIKWGIEGYTAPHGYKVVYAKDKMPVYSGDNYKYIADGSVTEYTATGIEPGTYNVRVCIYNGSGGCSMYTTNYKIVTVTGESTKEEDKAKEESENYATSITLQAEAIGDGKVKLTWSISGGEAPKGYKIAWASYGNPTYPEPNEGWKYISNPDKHEYTVTGLEAGKVLHFRVGVYHGGYCKPWSNDVTVTVQ